MASQTAGIRQSERRFFIGSALVVLALVFTGFFRTYYLRGLFTPKPLSAFLHVHGLVMSAWIATLAIQVLLVAVGKVSWHRSLGAFGAGVACLVVLSGTLATFRAAAREYAGHTENASSQITVLGLELTQLLLFAVLVTVGIWQRNRTDYHKRLMILATAAMLPNPISRLPISFDSNLVILLIFDGLVVAAIAYDTVRGRRLHPAFLWGGALLITALHVAYALAYSRAWHAFAARLVS